jgi:adenylate cyclase class IV
MARNVEIKARVADPDALRRRAARLAGASPEVIEQKDTFFAVVAGRLKVREFADGSGELISYHRPDDPGPKLSNYRRCACRNAAALADALTAVLPLAGVVKKQREVFLAGRTRIHLDRVDGLGAFVELEVVLAPGEPPGPGEAEARDLLAALGIPDSSLVAGAYLDLLQAGPAASTAG